MVWFRIQIALLFLAPVLLFAGLYAIGKAVPVPHLGREYVVRIALPEPGTTVELPPVLGPDDPTRPLVVIDAGHGGHDPGAVGAGFREKTLTLGLARNLRDQLLADGGIRVAMTRDEDKYLVLAERVQIARALGADLFISIHADSAGERDEVSGASIYTLSEEASSEAAARFAQRENEADIVNGIELSGGTESVNAILVELSQRRTSDASAQFSQLIVREGEGTLAFHPQSERSAALAVLRAPDVPSVLFEAGFISNPDEAERLASVEGQRAFAGAMAQAIRIHLAREADVSLQSAGVDAASSTDVVPEGEGETTAAPGAG
ncbi:N-acetylmuramoyl-L-alanine amidase family protein [Alteraurantiacibacter aquimixticola]|uniref:N-acetylmuramoyl-L-alanine amidase n=1 Tax=Alteraurantiacibacter aquimixticola TaxID=2489173 RepID=A0A4T3EZ02_9SPHN|nr:N-acetylmuramoyl-L-alanine amidase [Alteraurantiacibacter aquimixticola]TIX49971.1 N-acetylmuramoyl-L-alanine amidase [Alteraurantiacibacter aquimixticola]